MNEFFLKPESPKIQIRTAGDVSLIIPGGDLRELSQFCGERRVIVVTDHNVRRYHGERFSKFPIVSIPPGEDSKTLETARFLYQNFIELEVDRSVLIVGIGGGVVTDLTGFVATTFLRGIEFGFVATTLMAQIDAAIGGKNGVNLGNYKNSVGTFSQPRFVVLDHRLLSTLPKRHIVSGLAEMVKAGAIADLELFEFFENHYDSLIQLDSESIAFAVQRSAQVKAGFVEADEKDTGLRQLLNFGHTFGHAIEKSGNYTHGEAVSVGMVLAAWLSCERGLLDKIQVDRLVAILHKIGLPVSTKISAEVVEETLGKDKKRAGDKIRFVLLNRLGEAVVKKIPLTELIAFYRRKVQ